MRYVIHGIVQGVGFRPTVHRIARSMGLRGFVQNNGSNVVVEVDREGDEFMEALRSNLPPLARVDSVEVLVSGDRGYDDFRIVPSESGERGVGIPNDVAICDSCRRELFDPEDRRYLYPFTNCTDCGARFTVIEDLPYDRDSTSMRDFPMCPSCREEYEDPGDRRFHHQTISCPRCGPTYRLLGSDGDGVEGDPVRGFASRIDRGQIGIAKSWGGMHICSSLESLPRLRRWYGRREKPFAVMVRDMDTAERYCHLDGEERELLRSPHRPVTLVDKAEGIEGVSPGLDNLGIFLPYTAMHEILFHHLESDALIMTSANVPGEPMIMEDRGALSLGADCYLLHDRRIVNRCDDSVVRAWRGNTFFIRRSRGHVPCTLDSPFEGTAIGMGAQENLTATLAMEGSMHPTQYLGDGSSPGVLEFEEGAVSHLIRLLGVEEVGAVAMDMHPSYSNRRLAKSLSEKLDADLLEVQHHWAHSASLMVDRGEEEIVALTLDGTGYGLDGKAWGGEILHSTFLDFDRTGHLQEIPLLGGEKAVREVDRVLYAIQESLGRESDLFAPCDQGVFRKMMPSSPLTSSFGRVLDALSCHFDVCCLRSYDGEPAMKLEPLLRRGRKEHSFQVEWEGGTLLTLDMFEQLFESRGRREDLAHSFVSDLVTSLVDRAADLALSRGLDGVGLTGGVAYNQAISDMASQAAEARGLRLLVHDRVPNGDGGISTGQCAIALARNG
ncbi:MAG: carbamoyltransferase HypF [Methanomassiliicoccales archaeon]